MNDGVGFFACRNVRQVLESRGGRGALLGCAGPSRAFRVGHSLNAADVLLLCDDPDWPPASPGCLGQSRSHQERLWGLADPGEDFGSCHVYDGKPVGI